MAWISLACKSIYYIMHVSSMKQLMTAHGIWNHFLFEFDFGAHTYFQPTIHGPQNLVDFWAFSMPFCAKGAKRHGTGNYCIILVMVLS